MARRKGGLTELLEIASALPWKVSAVLVPASFICFHVIAVAFEHIAAPTDVAGMGPVVVRTYIHTFALLFQYIVPFVFLVGAGPDGGVDLSLARGHERFLVQCKQWRAQQVGVAVVRELYGVMAAEHVAGGYVVTSGSFTKDAKAFAAGRNIELMDGKALDGLLRKGRSAVLRPVDSMSEIGGTTPKAPVCPKCKVSMVLRTAKRGSKVGGSFWGCAQYPKCRRESDESVSSEMDRALWRSCYCATGLGDDTHLSVSKGWSDYLTDRPCDAPPSGGAVVRVSTTSPNGEVTKSMTALPTVVGDWRGQTQFQAGMNGVRVAEAQSVVPLVLTLSEDGKVTGSSPDNGCRVLGVWSPGATPRLFALDVSLNSCNYAKFNQRYSGNLIATFPERMAQLSLAASTLPFPGQSIWRLDVEATLRR